MLYVYVVVARNRLYGTKALSSIFDCTCLQGNNVCSALSSSVYEDKCAIKILTIIIIIIKLIRDAFVFTTQVTHFAHQRGAFD